MPGPVGTAFSDLNLGLGDQLNQQLNDQLDEQRKKKLQQQQMQQIAGYRGFSPSSAFQTLTGYGQ